MLHRSKLDIENRAGKEFVLVNAQPYIRLHKVMHDGKIAGCGIILRENPHGFIVPCGGKGYNGYEYCEECQPLVEKAYPQGYEYYPGDVCRHGNYTGGSGIDYICGQCEDGE
jgi:hypothetical protein